MRLFLAFPVDSATRKILATPLKNWRQRVKGCSWVPPENLHVTLKFLGEVPGERVDEIEKAMRIMVRDTEPFNLYPSGGGCFPNPRRARVLFADYRFPERLGDWVKTVHESFTRLGFEKENRAFRAHVTLARVRRGMVPGQVDQLLKEVDSLSLKERRTPS